MRLDSKQKQALAKNFSALGTYALTAIPFGFFMGSKDVSLWLYAGITVMGFGLMALGIYYSKEEKKETKDDKTIKADIKKGVFHIDNASINNNKLEA